MTRLIEVTRAFDGVAAEASQSEISLQDAIKTLGSLVMTRRAEPKAPLSRASSVASPGACAICRRRASAAS